MLTYPSYFIALRMVVAIGIVSVIGPGGRLHDVVLILVDSELSGSMFLSQSNLPRRIGRARTSAQETRSLL